MNEARDMLARGYSPRGKYLPIAKVRALSYNCRRRSSGGRDCRILETIFSTSPSCLECIIDGFGIIRSPNKLAYHNSKTSEPGPLPFSKKSGDHLSIPPSRTLEEQYQVAARNNTYKNGLLEEERPTRESSLV